MVKWAKIVSDETFRLHGIIHPLIIRSRLVMSESLAQQNPRSPFRRAPSMVRQQSRVGRTGSVSSGAFEQQTDDLIQLARTNIQKLREKEEKKVMVT